jgi:hypothetical protein
MAQQSGFGGRPQQQRDLFDPHCKHSPCAMLHFSGMASRFLRRADVDLRCQRAVHRASVRNLQKPRVLSSIQIALKRNDALDAIDHALFGFALSAIGSVNFAVVKTN